MKALVITYYWPPAGGSGVQRWLKFVKYLPSFGVTPVVYSPLHPNYPIVDNSFQKEVALDLPHIQLKIWEPNKVNSAQQKSVSAGFLGTKKTLVSRFIHYVRANFFIPDARCFWIKPSVKYLTKYLTENPVDVIITTGPPHSMHVIGYHLKKRLGVKWVADFRDPWTDIDYFHLLPFNAWALKKHHQLEQQVVSTADEVLVVGETMKEKYLKFNKNTTVITNGFDGAVVETENVVLDKEFTITHVGMLNEDRNPELLWKVLASLKTEIPFKLRLIGKIAPFVQEAICQSGLTDRVEIIDYVPHNQVLQYQQSSQVLLLLINNVPNAKGIITGKVFEYLQVKRPILAIAPPDGDLAAILQEINAGKVVDFQDEEQLKLVVVGYYQQFLNNQLKVVSNDVLQFHRKKLTEKLVKVLNKVVYEG